MKKNYSRNSRKGGWTLVEMSVVLVIIGLLALIFGLSNVGKADDGRRTGIALVANQVNKAIGVAETTGGLVTIGAGGTNDIDTTDVGTILTSLQTPIQYTTRLGASEEIQVDIGAVTAGDFTLDTSGTLPKLVPSY